MSCLHGEDHKHWYFINPSSIEVNKIGYVHIWDDVGEDPQSWLVNGFFFTVGVPGGGAAEFFLDQPTPWVGAALTIPKWASNQQFSSTKTWPDSNQKLGVYLVRVKSGLIYFSIHLEWACMEQPPKKKRISSQQALGLDPSVCVLSLFQKVSKRKTQSSRINPRASKVGKPVHGDLKLPNVTPPNHGWLFSPLLQKCTAENYLWGLHKPSCINMKT